MVGCRAAKFLRREDGDGEVGGERTEVVDMVRLIDDTEVEGIREEEEAKGGVEVWG